MSGRRGRRARRAPARERGGRCAGSPAATARRCSSSIANPSVSSTARWRPRCRAWCLHYALKPLPYAPVVATLRDLGACFDVATTGGGRARPVAARVAGTLHPHAPDQAGPRTSSPRCASASAGSSSTTPTSSASSPRTAAVRSCCCGSRSAIPPQSWTCRASSAASPRRSGRCSSWRGTSASASGACRFTSARRSSDPTRYVEAIDACRELIARARRDWPRPRPARHRRRVSRSPMAARCSRSARSASRSGVNSVTAARRAGDCRAGALHRGSGRDLRRVRRRPGAARGPLVVLPRRWRVRLLQRADLRPRASIRSTASTGRVRGSPACWRARPATASTSIREDIPLPALRDRRPARRPHDGRLYGGFGHRLQLRAARADRRGKPACGAASCRLTYWITWPVRGRRAASQS